MHDEPQDLKNVFLIMDNVFIWQNISTEYLL